MHRRCCVTGVCSSGRWYGFIWKLAHFYLALTSLLHWDFSITSLGEKKIHFKYRKQRTILKLHNVDIFILLWNYTWRYILALYRLDGYIHSPSYYSHLFRCCSVEYFSSFVKKRLFSSPIIIFYDCNSNHLNIHLRQFKQQSTTAYRRSFGWKSWRFSTPPCANIDFTFAAIIISIFFQ